MILTKSILAVALCVVGVACNQPPAPEPSPTWSPKMGSALVDPQSAPLASSHFYGHYAFVNDAGADADVDLLAASLNVSSGQASSPCRLIVPDSTGSLTVVRVDGSTATLTVATAGVGEPIEATKVVGSGTTVTGGKVYW